MKNFENIISTLSEEKKQQPFFTRLFNTVFSITAISFLVAMFFDSIIRNSGDLVKTIIVIPLILLTGSVIILGCIQTFRWIFLKKTDKPLKKIESKGLPFLGDELINRFRLDEKGFFNKIDLLKNYEKSELEEIRDWLDYRIKLEGISVAFILAVVKYLPNLEKNVNSLFENDGIFFLLGLTNPLKVGFFPISMDMILLLGTLMAVALTSFLPRRLKFFSMVKYAIAHGYHK